MSSTKPYSGTNPVPRVGEFLRQAAPGSREGDEDGRKEKGKTRKEAAHPTAKEQTRALRKGEGIKGGNRRTVTDPTTGREVEIEDVTGRIDDIAHGQDNIVVPRQSIPGEEGKIKSQDFAQPTQPYDEYAEKQDVTAPPAPVKPHTTTDVPIRGEKTNILLHPTPTLSLKDTVFANFEKRVTGLCIAIFTAIVLLGKVTGPGSTLGLLLTSAGVAGGVWYWAKNVMDEARTVDWETERKRGETAVSNLIPESVEWMNSLVAIVWGLVNPEMFTPIGDTIEDVLQSSCPGMIENVRVADISQGSNPIRILSVRSLPDAEVPDLKKAATAARDGRDKEQRKAEEDGGEVYNLEVAFAYNAAPVEQKGVSARARNMHMNLVFYCGIRGLVGVPLPIWVGLKGLVGTVRLRLQVSPDSPFLKTLTFTLMGIPQVSVSCIPMVEKGINVLNLPVISSFVNAAIATAANEYVAPKSMSLEIGKILMGDDIKKETQALGVLWVDIRKAVGLSKQDRRGSSDAYITIAFSKYGKPMYSTRVIVDDTNPIWNESTGILVTAEHVKANESLAIELWDSDRFTADDMVGKIEVPIHDLIINDGKMHDRVDELDGEEAGSKMPGRLDWAAGFFGKPQLRPAMRTSGKDVNLPKELEDDPALQDEKGSLDTETEDAVTHTPPDPLFPSGIVSVIVHQIVNLEVKDLKGTYGSRKNGKEYSPGMTTGENKEEQGGKLPSAYCTIALNDELIYRTRTKVMSSKPIFSAGTERFVRDWRSAMFTVSARDSRHREHDPLLGVVPLRLSEILQTSSAVTRWFPLDGGLGFGQIRLSVLFRSVGLSLPRQLLGWNVGTFEFLGDKITSTLPKTARLKFRTGGSTGKIPARNCRKVEGGVEWSVIIGKKGKRRLRLPVKHRYMSPITIDIYHSGSRRPDAHAMLWLNKLADNDCQTLTVPVWRTNNAKRLAQNHIERPDDHPTVEIEEIGAITFECTFSPGMDHSHERFATDNDARETYESWEACRSEGVRGDTVRAELAHAQKALHEQSIAQVRDDLARTDKGEVSRDDEEKFTDRYGKNWRDVFQAAKEDPGLVEGGARGSNTGHSHHSGSLNKYHEDDDDEEEEEEEEETDDEGSSESSEGKRGSSDGSYHHIESEREDGCEKEKSGPLKALKSYRENQRNLHRNHKGLMQWKPVRGLVFAKDEIKVGARKVRGRTKLEGRKPDVETEA